MRSSFLLLLGVLVHNVLSIPTHSKRDAAFVDVRTHLRHSYQNKDKDEPDKYFHEAKFHQHYDGRFADKKLDYDERRQHLTALVQTYFSTMNDIGAETWIMHGSLLGWWWNRKVLPWDSDIDVMVSEKSIHLLAEYYNMTIHHYHLPGSDEARDYMLEINPHYTNDSIESSNKIDARWIDTDTGLFIDITTLRRNKTAEALGIEGAMMVKDKHHYLYDDIYPLRDSNFEGFPVKIPFAYGEILVEEYKERALSRIYWENHRFDPEQKEWVPLSCHDFGTCANFRSDDDLSVPPDGGRNRRPSYINPPRGPRGMHRVPPRGSMDPEDRPLPPQLVKNRNWRYGRWEG